jgi:hypothetical protein
MPVQVQVRVRKQVQMPAWEQPRADKCAHTLKLNWFNEQGAKVT